MALTANAPTPIPRATGTFECYGIATHNQAFWASCASSGADVTQTCDNGEPLYQAAWRRDESVIEILLSQGANPDKVDAKGFADYPLAAVAHQCRESGEEVSFAICERVTRCLIAAGANINGVPGKPTPLMRASSGGRSLPYIELLIALGAEVNAKDRQGNTALDYARSADSTRSEVIDTLKRKGASGSLMTFIAGFFFHLIGIGMH